MDRRHAQPAAAAAFKGNHLRSYGNFVLSSRSVRGSDGSTTAQCKNHQRGQQMTAVARDHHLGDETCCHFVSFLILLFVSSSSRVLNGCLRCCYQCFVWITQPKTDNNNNDDKSERARICPPTCGRHTECFMSLRLIKYSSLRLLSSFNVLLIGLISWLILEDYQNYRCRFG